MLSLSGAGATCSHALERVAGLVSRFTTTEQYGDPTLPPSPEKKRAYRIWFGSIMLLEIYMVRRTQDMLDEYTELAVKSEFMLHTQVLNIATMLFIDLYTLRSLNALSERSGLRFPSRMRGVPVLVVSEENSVLFRHFFKLIHRFSVVNCLLLGGKPDGFHAYPVKQIYIMILSPTFFGVLFAVKSVEGLLKLSFINVAFTAASALSVKFAYKYSEHRKRAYMEELGGQENVPRVFTTVAVVLALAPFVSSLVVRLGKFDFAPRVDPDPEARGRKAASGQPAMMTNERAASVSDSELNPELSASAICFQGPEPQTVVVRHSLAGVSPRVTFDGRVLESSGEPIDEARVDETRTLLRVFPPGSSNRNAPIGRAWVTAGSFIRNVGLKSADADPDLFRPVGEAVPLLFVPDAKTACEVNEMVALVRKKVGDVYANQMLARLGNCMTRATYNARDLDAMMEVVAALGAKRCEAMLRNLAEEADFQTGDASGAPSWKAAKGQYRERDVSWRRVRHSASTSSSEDTDVVEGPATDARDKPVGTWTRSRR
jgi:hypothetical protein